MLSVQDEYLFYSEQVMAHKIKIVVYEPFWHQPPDTWIVAEWSDKHKEVLLERAKLRQAVHQLLTKRGAI